MIHGKSAIVADRRPAGGIADLSPVQYIPNELPCAVPIPRVSPLFKPRRESKAKKPLGESLPSESSGSSGSGLRRVLVGLGVAALAFLAARRVRKSGRTPSMDEVKETVGDVRSGEAFEIPIGETGEAAEGSETGAEWTGTTEGAIGKEPMPGEDLSSGKDEERTGEGVQEEPTETEEDLSPEAIEDRAAEDAHEEPTEPGEMSVDEDIAEDVVDEEEADPGTAEAETGETRAETDEAETDEAETTEGEGGETDESQESDEGQESDEDGESA